MRNGLKWWQLAALVALGVGALCIQRGIGESVEHYTTLSRSACIAKSWSDSGSDDHALQGNFACGNYLVSISNGNLLAKYQKSHRMACTLKRGDLLRDENWDCKA